ncbi:hypothetical protein [Flavilitoribacter nigricans]|uniref:Outer membrane protein beta-barrel domain-containing protein n=1 Tax=Flavilitoribacter nigricans (strain ATCC 23147 / DSM 23189 / NBRC 102662 / NCIMB 1420 / SS-2) TaxID=1122177 RepID=A0A2D0NET8_FLAN2|nr:hypothetical protein [Flavilitoribacter nigricans]PHN07012.1 hypothetical protein CRP01_08615 [Flavilitoribacter nigricans DSM 23189 = NBRC 102662]
MKKFSLLFLCLSLGLSLAAQRSALEIGLSNVASEPDMDGPGIGIHFAHQFRPWLEAGFGLTSSSAYDERIQQRFLQGYLTGRIYASLIPLHFAQKGYVRLGAAYNFTQENKVWLITDTEGREILEEAVRGWDWMGGTVHAGLGWALNDHWAVEARANLGGYTEARLLGDWGIYLRRYF